MTSSFCLFDDVIKMRHLKNRMFPGIFAEYLKNGATDFHPTYAIFKKPYIKVFEIRKLKVGHSLLPW